MQTSPPLDETPGVPSFVISRDILRGRGLPRCTRLCRSAHTTVAGPEVCAKTRVGMQKCSSFFAVRRRLLATRRSLSHQISLGLPKNAESLTSSSAHDQVRQINCMPSPVFPNPLYTVWPASSSRKRYIMQIRTDGSVIRIAEDRTISASKRLNFSSPRR